MFGYITIDKEKLKPNEIGLYQTFMCGICLSTKKLFGNYARAFVNYDINFFNILFHSVLDKEVTIYNDRCLASPIKKRSLLQSNDLTDILATSNVILSFVNIYDDVLDEKSAKKKIILNKYRKPYSKACGLFPDLNWKVSTLYEQLRFLENSDCNVLDKICHNFAQLSQVFAKLVLKENANEFVLDLCYNMGKWVYLVDALDDLEKDYKKSNYNPLIATFGNFTNAKEFVKTNYDDIKFELFATLNKIAQAYNDLNLTKYRCVLNNIIYEQIREKTNSILDGYILDTNKEKK